jgi:hypothetical protein
MYPIIQNNSVIILLATFSLVAFLLLFNIVLTVKIWKINRKNKELFSGKDGKNLETVILGQGKAIQEFDKDIQELFEISNKIHNLALKSLHKIGIIRFNPFKDIGGDQSFAIALLDGKNSGLVISSLHTREGTRVYAKPVVQSESQKYPLTEEERQAIKIASPIKENFKL